MEKNENEKQIVFTKLDLSWFTLSVYFEDIQCRVGLIKDKKLTCLFEALLNYINEKLAIQKGDIEDTYVVVEQILER